jgi:uncharacterized protein
VSEATRFLPSREPIDSFGSGGFRFGGMSHQGSVLVLPSGMRAWPVSSLQQCSPDDFSEFIRERSDIDMLLVGSGGTMDMLPVAVRKYLTEHGVSFEVMTTSAAIHIYNIVLGEGRRVAAGLVSVVDARVV